MFRFWDWTAPETGTEGLPRVLYEPTLSLAMPNGSTSTVDNILAFYEFGSGLPTGFTNVLSQNPISGDPFMSYFAEWKRTYRWPDGAQTKVVENYDALNG